MVETDVSITGALEITPDLPKFIRKPMSISCHDAINDFLKTRDEGKNVLCQKGHHQTGAGSVCSAVDAVADSWHKNREGWPLHHHWMQEALCHLPPRSSVRLYLQQVPRIRRGVVRFFLYFFVRAVTLLTVSHCKKNTGAILMTTTARTSTPSTTAARNAPWW